jgi:hypothetical protein
MVTTALIQDFKGERDNPKMQMEIPCKPKK